MFVRQPLSRRRFFGGVAAAMGVLGLRPSLLAQGGTAQFRGSDADYDAFAKLASNENPLRSRIEGFQQLSLADRSLNSLFGRSRVAYTQQLRYERQVAETCAELEFGLDASLN